MSGEGSGKVNGSELFEEMVKPVEWALRFKLSFGDP
jgi:hypothetical protein